MMGSSEMNTGCLYLPGYYFLLGISEGLFEYSFLIDNICGANGLCIRGKLLCFLLGKW